MKKVIVVLALLAMAVPAMAVITGTAHDFSGAAWNSASGGKCNVCHAPHSADTSVVGAPLWNHEVTGVASFTLYSSVTIQASDLGQPDGPSKLCLSCHDGTVELDSFGGASGSTLIGAPGLVGTDLSGEHPISFTYDATLAGLDDGLYDPSAQASGLGGNIDEDLLYGGLTLECSSCHDVHDKDGNSSLLVIDNAASALCLTCHDK